MCRHEPAVTGSYNAVNLLPASAERRRHRRRHLGLSSAHARAEDALHSVSAVASSGRPSRVNDLHRLAQAMPHVTVEVGRSGNRIYQVGGKSFVFFRTPRPDAVDPETGQRYDDIVVIWVASDEDKEALVQDPSSPFFTTPHFDGHPSVLVRSSRVGEVDVGELTEIVQDAWLAQASSRRAREWLASHGIERSS